MYGRNVARNGLSGLKPIRSGNSFAASLAPMLSVDINSTSNKSDFKSGRARDKTNLLYLGPPRKGKRETLHRRQTAGSSSSETNKNGTRMNRAPLSCQIRFVAVKGLCFLLSYCLPLTTVPGFGAL